ncbi:hypothetical protein SAMN02745857_01077 [Andreprevotia lacus DSM 23236]|jgi:hypothetical protein|uniref:Uncharacterized protein n=1 Tax=Andreprevotia lacus DSM 23236 TaxID=1121001 RepID=A0A1W1XAN6_9NEIS|nr:hypothetical protein [Andreprevotia lacus]SMC20907.1 hypothetical protein SAMN02745857_01077 [Andreprevotia lacus DSM 23236]
MNFSQIDYLFFGHLSGMPVIGFFGGIFAAIAYRLLDPEKVGTKSVSEVIISALKRILLGGAIFLVFLVLSILSAIPYGGGNRGLFLACRVAFVLAPFWAAFTVVDVRTAQATRVDAQDESGGKPSGKWHMVGITLACLSAVIVLRAMLATPPLSPEEIESKAQGKQRELAIAQCSKEISTVANEYIVDSLLLDANMINKNALESLLGGQGVRFVELKAGQIKIWNSKKEKWGVMIFDGDDRNNIELDSNKKYVRFELSRNGDPLCETSTLHILDGSPRAPFAPGACLRMVPDQKSLASHAIKALPAGDKTGFIRWSLLEQASGHVLAALISSDLPHSPARQGGGADIEWKIAQYGAVSCRQPYFTLTNALRGVPQNTRQSLSLVTRKIEPELVDLGVKSIIWPEIKVDEVEGPAGPNNTYPWGKDWEFAYKKAESTGFADVGTELIDYKAGELLSLGNLKFEGQWLNPHIGASPNGFVAVFGRPNGIHLVRYALDGEMQWQGIIQVNGRDSTAPARPDIAEIKWEENEVDIYVFRKNGKGESRWLLQVPNAMIGLR